MKTFPEYESFDGLGLAQLVKKGAISAKELLTAAIERIEEKNPTLNAVIHTLFDAAYLQIAKGLNEGVFSGVPFLLKDMLAEVENTPMRWGSRLMENYISPIDSALVKRYRKAGLVFIGKTNLPEFGLSPTTEPDSFGATLNPWDRSKSPGGSSGGSAVAVATLMVPMAHGGDGGGSLRIPASYCGVVGFKPSRGRTPTGPRVMRLSQGMVVEHALTRTVRDSAALLDVSAEQELGSPIALPKPRSSYLEALQKNPKKLRIAVHPSPFFPSQVHSEYIQALEETARLCCDLGHEVRLSQVNLNSEELSIAFVIVMSSEIAAGIKSLAQTCNDKPDFLKLEAATAVLAAVGEHFRATDFVWATHVLDSAERKLAEFFEHYDILLSPTMASPPPPLGELKPSPFEANILEILRRIAYGPLLRRLVKKTALKFLAKTPFTPLFNITGQPAISLPLYWDKTGLPIGMQFAGRLGDEKTLLQLARQLEVAKPWLQRYAFNQ